MREYRRWNPFANTPFVGHAGAVWACAITSDNLTVFSGSEDNTVKIWDATTQELKCTFSDHTKCVNGLVVTNDDQFLISGGWDNNINIYDWKNQVRVGTLDGHTGGVYSFALTKDGKYLLSGSGDYSVKVWNLESRSLVASLSCEQNSVFAVCVTNDNSEVIAGGWGGFIRIFNFANFTMTSSHDGKSGVVQAMTLTNDGKFLIFGTRNNVIKVWNYKDKSDYCTFTSHENWVRNIVSTVDSNFFVSVSADKTIRVFNIQNKSEEVMLEGSEGYVFGECISKDGQFLLTGASDKIMRIWKLGKAVRVQSLKGHSKCVMSLAISRDNQWVVTGSEDQTVKVWSIEQKCEVASLTGHSGTVWGVTITDNGRYIASCAGDNKVILWNFAERTMAAELTGHTNPIFCIACTRDNKFVVTGAQDKYVGVFNINEQKKEALLEGHTDTVFTVKVTNDNQFIVSGAADYTIRIWDLAKLIQVQKFETKAGMIESVALSYDDKYLVLGDRANGVHLWDWKEKKSIKKFQQHTKWVKCVNFSADGNIFASASNDYTVRLWNASEERHEFVLKGHTSTIRTVGFTGDGRYVISAGEDLTVKLWNIKDIGIMELADVGTSVDTFLYLTKIKTKAHPSKDIFQSVFGSLKVNLAHFYSYLGFDELLIEALRLGTEIRIDDDGNSPLHYALDRSTQSCVDNILMYMIELKNQDMQKFLNYAYALRADFEILLDNRSINLPEFLESIFYIVPNMTNFAMPVSQLPILNYSHQKTFCLDHFVFEGDNIPEGASEIPIEFKTLPFAINHVSGSAGSIDLLDSISNCPNQQILKTEFVRLFVRNKWNSLWYYILLLTFLMWSNLAMMVVLLIVGSYEDKPLNSDYTPLVIAFFVVNGLLSTYEMIQAFSTGITYFTDFWNLVDMARIALCATWALLLFEYTPNQIYPLTWSMAIINFFRCLSGFRAFDTTRFYTRLIFRAFNDAISFVLIFFYSTFAFGVIFFTSKEHAADSTDEIFALWRSPYALNMGDFDSDAVTSGFLSYIYFMMASVINVIIMLNLLISILGDSFESFQNECMEIDVLEMASLVIELETLMFWKKNIHSKKYIQICQDLKVGGSEEWEGRVKAISNAVERARKESNEKLTIIIGKLDQLLSR